jgi:hypothetical protein
MIDPLDTATNYLDWGRLDEAETICGTVLKATSDDSWVPCLLARATSARKAHARALDDLARAEDSEFAHLYVETPIAHPRLGACGAAVRAADRAVLLAPDVPNGYQTLAHLVCHGDNHQRVLRRIHAWLKPNNYVAIGGRQTFNASPDARQAEYDAGIDPSTDLQVFCPRRVTLLPFATDADHGYACSGSTVRTNQPEQCSFPRCDLY